ncbi:DUF4429 domain-containing protein [Streptosporangium soli]
MADVLVGQGGSWTFEAGVVRVRHDRGVKVPKLLQALGERVIPYEAFADVSLTKGKRGTVVLRAMPRPGADPLLIAAAGQLKEAQDPYRLVLPAEREALADHYAEEIRRGIVDRAPTPRCLVEGPTVPRTFKAWDGQVAFDGETVLLQWFWSGADSRKYKTGDQAIPVSSIESVEWRSPDVYDGYLRFRVRGQKPPTDPAHDPASVVFGMGYGVTAESLPLAAAVVAAIQRAGRTTDAAADAALRTAGTARETGGSQRDSAVVAPPETGRTAAGGSRRDPAHDSLPFAAGGPGRRLASDAAEREDVRVAGGPGRRLGDDAERTGDRVTGAPRLSGGDTTGAVVDPRRGSAAVEASPGGEAWSGPEAGGGLRTAYPQDPASERRGAQGTRAGNELRAAHDTDPGSGLRAAHDMDPGSERRAAHGVGAAVVDIPDLIRKLGELRDAGLLTDEEFQAKKAELLARL